LAELLLESQQLGVVGVISQRGNDEFELVRDVSMVMRADV